MNGTQRNKWPWLMTYGNNNNNVDNNFKMVMFPLFKAVPSQTTRVCIIAALSMIFRGHGPPTILICLYQWWRCMLQAGYMGMGIVSYIYWVDSDSNFFFPLSIMIGDGLITWYKCWQNIHMKYFACISQALNVNSLINTGVTMSYSWYSEPLIWSPCRIHLSDEATESTTWLN